MTVKITFKANRQFGRGAQKVQALAKAIVEEYTEEFVVAAQNAIQEKNYDVEFNSTRRVSKEFVPRGRRNIVDSGKLLDSLYVVEKGSAVEIGWAAPHAQAVLSGYYTYNAAGRPTGRFMPGRDWIAVAQREVPLPSARRGSVVARRGAQVIQG